METYDNHDKLKLIKHFLIFNMLQQPSYYININKTDKKSTEFIPKVPQSIIENDSEFSIPVCDKLTMAKFLVILKLLQEPYHNKNMNKTFENSPISINNENKATPNNLSLSKNSINKPNSKFMFFIRQVTFNSNSQSIKRKGEINTEDNVYETYENEPSDYLENSVSPPPIIIEEKDIETVIDNE
ncbi:hypothetical protein [Clostridium sp.]|uniref:hypothetical protein n=1 Tax=Clostridium sp. TaxID=1506 RepID=UPI0026016C38|nr:hypothetical protein [uncultured Clostridium sp.]